MKKVIDSDILLVSGKLRSSDSHTPLKVVCGLLGVPVPEGMADAGRFDDLTGLNGGEVGRTYAQQWASQELLGRNGAEKRICEWLFILTGEITPDQFGIWAQCLRDRVWPWFNEAMDHQEAETLEKFQFWAKYPENGAEVVPVGFKVGPPWYVVDPSPMRST